MPKGDMRFQTPAGRKQVAKYNAAFKRWRDVQNAGEEQRKQLAKGRSTTVTKPTSDGAQQWVRGEDATDRVKTAGKAVMSTKNNKAQQMLLKAQKSEMGGKARASLSQASENEKRVSLARGRSSAADRASRKAPNAAVKSAHKGAWLKSLKK